MDGNSDLTMSGPSVLPVNVKKYISIQPIEL